MPISCALLELDRADHIQSSPDCWLTLGRDRTASDRWTRRKAVHGGSHATSCRVTVHRTEPVRHVWTLHAAVVVAEYRARAAGVRAAARASRLSRRAASRATTGSIRA